MQAIARPVARLACSHARQGLDPATWAGLTRLRQIRSPPQSPMTVCLRCSFRAIANSGRFYSTQPPSKDTESSPSKQSDKQDEPRAPATEPDAEHNAKPVIEPESAMKVYPSRSDTENKDEASKHELPSATDSRRAALERSFSQLMDSLQARALTASQTLNDITGYSAIENIKRQNAELEIALADAQSRVHSARQSYKTANTKRAATQREVTALLARKDTWSPTDLERFTELYRTDHILEGEVASSQEALTEAEIDEQSLSQRLNSGILKRYHEEQIWSDRIRRASTWGTWGLMGMNFILFVILQFVAEPWKRRRLVRGVVAEEKAVLEEVRGQLEEVKLALEGRGQGHISELPAEGEITEASVSPTMETPAATGEDAKAPLGEPAPEPEMASDIPTQGAWKEWLLDPVKWRATAEDLYSDRQVSFRMRDASLLALQGALAGAALTGSVALLLVRKP